jgi:hypothetical protein
MAAGSSEGDGPMGYGVMAYAVDDSVWGAVGSGSEELVELYLRDAQTEIESIDELLADLGPADPPLPDARTALRQLVMGQPYDQRAGVAYAYWFKHLCEDGQFLRNDAWMPIRVAFLEQVQGGLARAGVEGVSVSSMVFGGLPIRLPAPDDFPGMGYVSRTHAQIHLAAINAADLSAEPDRDVREAIEQLRDWLRVCAESGRDLVCFYH